MNFGFYRRWKIERSRLFRTTTFILLYFISTFLIIPSLASLGDRTTLPIKRSGTLIPHNYITVILNRHYVRPKLKSDLIEISHRINTENGDLKVSYLDANFPFLDGFPLLPHLSHNDGRKVDLCFYYTKDGKSGTLKPSNSGYGKFVEPSENEVNQTQICKSRGYWQYDYTRFATLGSRNDLEFDQPNTKKLINLIVREPSTQMLLIEPHLKNRMNLGNSKIRFHGCHAVRHDDHIHYQIKR